MTIKSINLVRALFNRPSWQEDIFGLIRREMSRAADDTYHGRPARYAMSARHRAPALPRRESAEAGVVPEQDVEASLRRNVERLRRFRAQMGAHAAPGEDSRRGANGSSGNGSSGNVAVLHFHRRTAH